MCGFLRIVAVHNYYQQPGGEDRVFEAEADLLERNGHTVQRFTVHNDAVRDMNRLELACATVWNTAEYEKLRGLFGSFRPDLVHVHNTLPLISPAVYYAARAENAAVVQTLHNYRLVCPAGTLYRGGRPCELCVGRAIPWPGVVHACYRTSRPATAVVAGTLSYHRARGTYRKGVDRFIALTRFAKEKFVQGGIRPEAIRVKPNFVAEDPGPGDGAGGYALFVGRLSEEKGVLPLLDAWERAGSRLPLRVVGGGPLYDHVRELSRRLPFLTLLGPLEADRVREEMRGAMILVVPSLWYEGFPLVVAEAFAAGTPVLTTNLGALPEIVDAGRTGMTFDPRQSGDLARCAASVADHPEHVMAMRPEARKEYERLYSAGTNYETLTSIYGEALSARDR